jgi:hypothetical protein
MDKIDEQEILEKLEMLEEIEQLDQKITETVKRIYDIPQKQIALTEELIFDALVSLPRIIKREQEDIRLLLSYTILTDIDIAEIPPYRRKEYSTKVGNLELSPELPEELRKELIPEYG